jgi:hypothetical protein
VRDHLLGDRVHELKKAQRRVPIVAKVEGARVDGLVA